jgi:tetratricopeptide (TPR) repeat protein
MNDVKALVCSIILFGGLIAACSGLSTGGSFQAGRQALLRGDSETALRHLSAAAERDPNYVFVIQNYPQSVWTSLGRAQYETGRYGEARRSLQKALDLNRNDSMAMLYLGLTMMRTGDGAAGVRLAENGMQGLYEWIEYMNRTQPFKDFWDPTRKIRKQIDQNLAALSSRDLGRREILAEVEWVGREFEEELGRVREDERRQFERDNTRERRVM